jgi:hypothetical protein
MSKLNKASWSNSENRVNISFPIAKINKEKRTVSGFATLDNIDRHGDIVTSDASEKAFARFRGNLREMHQPIAVGKVVSFKPQDFFDKETEQHFKGVYVDAYISKGAQDTWEKVLDGTLTGFSIGGNIVDAGYQPGDKEDNRVIKDYELMELSLVDSPANPLANIFSIQKGVDGLMFKGIATDIDLENIFWCNADQIATTSPLEKTDCAICSTSMSAIGWVESSDTEKSAVIEKTVNDYLQKDDAPDSNHSATTMDGDAGVISSDKTINLYPDQNKFKGNKNKTLSKGGNEEMAEETTTEVVEATQVDELVEEVAEATETVGETVEEASTVYEVPVEDLDFTKMLDGLKTDVVGTIEKNYATHAATIADMFAAVNSVKEEFGKSITDFGTTTTELSNNVADLLKRIDVLEKRIDAYESDTAVKKSGDLEKSTESTKIEKSIWQGHFLGVKSL